MKKHYKITLQSSLTQNESVILAPRQNKIEAYRHRKTRKGYIVQTETEKLEQSPNTVVHIARHMIGQFLMTGVNNFTVNNTSIINQNNMIDQADGSWNPSPQPNINTGLRLFKIGCGAVSGISSLGGTPRPPAEFDSSDPSSADVYTPLAFLSSSEYGALDTAAQKKYHNPSQLDGTQTCYYMKVLDKIETYLEPGLIIPLALKVTLYVDYTEANYNSQDWNRSSLNSWENSQQITYINELGLYFANVNNLDDSTNWWMYAHVTTVSYPKDPDTAYTFVWTLYF